MHFPLSATVMLFSLSSLPFYSNNSCTHFVWIYFVKHGKSHFRSLSHFNGYNFKCETAFLMYYNIFSFYIIFFYYDWIKWFFVRLFFLHLCLTLQFIIKGNKRIFTVNTLYTVYTRVYNLVICIRLCTFFFVQVLVL